MQIKEISPSVILAADVADSICHDPVIVATYMHPFLRNGKADLIDPGQRSCLSGELKLCCSSPDVSISVIPPTTPETLLS